MILCLVITITDFCLVIIVIDLLFRFQVAIVQTEILSTLDLDGSAAISLGQIASAAVAESGVSEHVCN